MKLNRSGQIVLMFFLVGVIFFGKEGFCQEMSSLVLVNKSLDRWVDPVVMEGSLLDTTINKPIANLRLYAFYKGTFEPIRYQIDEITAEGDWILPEGPISNGDLSNGKFDPQDKLVFMADDTGDRIAKEAWTPNFSSGEEIEVIDPLTGEKGWCYLLYFASNPPAQCSLPPYVDYDYTTETWNAELWGTQFIITKDGLHSTFYKRAWDTIKAGGNEKNYIDRVKVRIRLKAFFGRLTVRTNEEQLKSNVMAYKRGPVRVIRRVEQYVQIPGGFKAMCVVTDTMFYRNTCTVPVTFNIPFQLDTLVTSSVVRFGTDFSPNVMGSKTYNSNNLKGFLINGKMDDGEEKFNPGIDKWRVITGEFGTLLTQTIYTPEILRDIKITLGLLDDVEHLDPPEACPGLIGYLWQDWDITKLKRGKYSLFIQFYHPPYYKVGDEQKYIASVNSLVKIRVADQEGESKVLLLSKLGKRYN